MIALHTTGYRFQLRAAGIAWFQDHVLLHRLEGDDFWTLPGGRIELGEEAAHTIEREFNEELGIAVECSELLCVGENFFQHQGERHHEIGLYFSVQLPQSCSLLNLDITHFGIEGNRRLEFKWFGRAKLAEVDFRPLEVSKILAPAAILQRHFVQHAK